MQENKREFNERKDNPKEGKVNVSQKFVIALSIVSILGFLEIISSSLFNIDISDYIESLWLIIIGVGLVIEARIKKLKLITKKGLTQDNMTHLTTIVIGFLAIISGILSLPEIGIDNPAFTATKGIVSIIAILFILIQTLLMRHEEPEEQGEEE